MLKKIKLLVLFLLGAFVLCGGDNSNYNIAFVGDIHYDRMEFHDTSKIKHLGIPQGKHVLNKDGYYSWRLQTKWVELNKGASIEKNTPLNEMMWKKYIPSLLDNAAAQAKADNVKYTFQLGDMIHGDCYDFNLHKNNLEQSLLQLTSRFNNVLVVSGNHDTRGTDGDKAWDVVINSHLDKTVKNLKRKNTNYYFTIGKDLYLCYDVMNVDIKFFEDAVKANPGFRYLFFISHVPLLPTGKHAVRSILCDDIRQLFALLEKCNAIVISGHTHKISVVEYFNKAKNRRMSQFILNSTARFPEKQLKFKEEVPASDAFSEKAGKSKELWNKFYKGKVTTKLHTNGTGFGILRVTDKGVYMDYRNQTDSKVYTYKLR